MAWAQIVFWAALVPLLVVLLIVYLKSRTLYRLLYIVSVFTYAMTIMYTIDAYDLGRNAIIALLALSAVLMMWLGTWFRRHPAFRHVHRKGGRR